MARPLTNPFGTSDHKTEIGSAHQTTFPGFTPWGSGFQPAIGHPPTSVQPTHAAQSSPVASAPTWPPYPPQPIFMLPPNWSFPGTSQQPSYHLSFVNDTDMLNVAFSNNQDRTVFARLIGRGTKFDLDVPMDQNLHIMVSTVSTSKPSHEITNTANMVATADSDPFLLRNH
jgi:hypothetical protein